MRKLKVGVIGCGQVAQIVWLPYIHELDEYDIVAISDISLKLLDYYGNLYGVKKCYRDWHELINDKEVEAVIVLNSNHTEVCIEAAKAGKHILVEKPLCENIRQAEEIEKAVTENNVLLMVGEMKRYDSGYKYARNLIQNMKGLRMIRSRDVCDGLAASQPEIYESRRRTDVEQSVKEKINQNFNQGLKEVTGELSENLYFRLLLAGVHDIDILRAAFGEPEKVKNAVADAAAGFENGTKHVFCGPLYNQSGKELVKAGEVYIEPKSSPTFGEVLQGIDIKK